MADLGAEYRALFAEEARLRLDRLTTELLQLESDPSNAELIMSIFRDAHTLKGGAAMVGLDQTRAVTHAMEDLLEELRDGSRMATSRLTDALLAAVDVVRALIEAGQTGKEDAEAAEESVTLLRAMQVSEGHDTALPQIVPAEPTPVVDDPVVAPAPTAAEQDVDSDELAVALAADDATPATPAVRRAPQIMLQVSVDRLDELHRLVSETAAAHLRLGNWISSNVGGDPGVVREYRAVSNILSSLQETAMRARMVTLEQLSQNLHRSVRDLARRAGKEIRWDVRGEDTEVDRHVLEQLADPLLHIVRNAVDHGIETPDVREAAGKPAKGTIRLHAMQLGSQVIIAVSDDGRGIDLDRVRDTASRRGIDVAGVPETQEMYLIFRSGFSTAEKITDVSGRGVGLDVVRSKLEGIRGRIEVDSQVGSGTEFRITVPTSLAIMPCMVVSAAGLPLGIPMHSVLTVLPPLSGDEIHVDGRPVVLADGLPVPVTGLAATLGTGPASRGPAVVVAGLTRSHAFRVDELMGQREIVVKAFGTLTPSSGLFSGAGLEPDGSVILTVEAGGLINKARRLQGRGVVSDAATATAATSASSVARGRGTVLVVDDALTVRELQRSILETAGYTVHTASNGAEAMARLRDLDVDLILTDVEMPEMDGFALTAAVRRDERLGQVPVVILTSRATDKDRQRGFEVGADAYITKRAFDQRTLLDVVERLLGSRS